MKKTIELTFEQWGIVQAFVDHGVRTLLGAGYGPEDPDVVEAEWIAKEIESPALIHGLLKLLDEPQQREADRLAREALGEKEPGNIA